MTTSSLYKKEQGVILATLFCFVVAGLFMPSLKGYLLSQNAIAAPIIAHAETEFLRDFAASIDYSVFEIPEETIEETIEEPITEITEPEKEEKKKEEKKNQTTKPSSNNQTSSSNNSSANTSSSGNASSGSSSSSSSDTTTEKIWVEPVYEIIHHEAVYETVKSVICNYCSASFGSTSEFQVHKDANGG